MSLSESLTQLQGATLRPLRETFGLLTQRRQQKAQATDAEAAARRAPADPDYLRDIGMAVDF